MRVRAFRYGPLSVLQIPMTKAEVDKCLELGRERTELDEKKLSWKYRHPGLPSDRAHAIGFMGETAFEKWLKAHQLEPQRHYAVGEPFVESLWDIEQDFTFGTKTVGVKTADKPSLRAATQYGYFLYPAKRTTEEARRVLDYPDFLVQAVMDTAGLCCWLCGFAQRDAVMTSPVSMIVGKPAHTIPLERYRSLNLLLETLGLVAMTQERLLP